MNCKFCSKKIQDKEYSKCCNNHPIHSECLVNNIDKQCKCGILLCYSVFTLDGEELGLPESYENYIFHFNEHEEKDKYINKISIKDRTITGTKLTVTKQWAEKLEEICKELSVNIMDYFEWEEDNYENRLKYLSLYLPFLKLPKFVITYLMSLNKKVFEDWIIKLDGRITKFLDYIARGDYIQDCLDLEEYKDYDNDDNIELYHELSHKHIMKLIECPADIYILRLFNKLMRAGKEEIGNNIYGDSMEDLIFKGINFDDIIPDILDDADLLITATENKYISGMFGNDYHHAIPQNWFIRIETSVPKEIKPKSECRINIIPCGKYSYLLTTFNKENNRIKLFERNELIFDSFFRGFKILTGCEWKSLQEQRDENKIHKQKIQDEEPGEIKDDLEIIKNIQICPKCHSEIINKCEIISELCIQCSGNLVIDSGKCKGVKFKIAYMDNDFTDYIIKYINLKNYTLKLFKEYALYRRYIDYKNRID